MALITGAARGIGRATAGLLAKEGAFVVVTDVRDEEGRAAAEAIGEQAAYCRLDVRSEDEWEEAIAFVEEREARMLALTRDTPLRRFGTPEEVAHAVLYLASEESAYTTGSELNLDGGILAGSAASPGRD